MKTKIVGHAICPVGTAAGHDGDEIRANLLSDGTIGCYICETCYPKMSAPMLKVWRTIASCYGTTPKVRLGSSLQPGTREYDLACLGGSDPAVSDQVCAKYTRKNETATLQYHESDERELSSPDRSIGRDLSVDERAQLSPMMNSCVTELEALGFRVQHVANDSMGLRVVMNIGRSVGSMGYVAGAQVELRRA
jgi:hypothetical protein